MGKACKANELCRFCYELQDVLWQSGQKISAKIAVWTSDIDSRHPKVHASCASCTFVWYLNPGCQHFGWFPLPLCLRLHLRSKALSFEVPLQSFVLLVRFLLVAVLGKNVQIWSLLLWCDVQDFAWYICAGHQRMIAICNHGVIVSTGAPYVSTVQSDHPGSWSPKFGWSLVPVVITQQVLWLDRRMAPLYWKQRSGLDTAADHATPHRLLWSGLTSMLFNSIWNMKHADLGCASQEIDTTKGPLAGLLVLYKMSRGAWVWHKILLVVWGM